MQDKQKSSKEAHDQLVKAREENVQLKRQIINIKNKVQSAEEKSIEEEYVKLKKKQEGIEK